MSYECWVEDHEHCRECGCGCHVQDQQIGAQGGDGPEGNCRGCGDPASKHEGAFCAAHYHQNGSGDD